MIAAAFGAVGRAAATRWPLATDRLRRRIIKALGGFAPADPHAAMRGELVERAPMIVPRVPGTNTIWHVEGGEVRALRCDDILALPRMPEGSHASFEPAYFDTAACERYVEWIRRTLWRCAPWVRCYVGGPIVYTRPGHDGQHTIRPVGLAIYESDGVPSTILLDLSRGFLLAAEYLHHEIWHVIEHDALNDAAVCVVDAAIEGAREHGGDSYFDSLIERRARAYALAARLRDQAPGLRMPLWTGGEDMTAPRLIESVWSGEFSRELGIGYRRDLTRTPAELVAANLAATGRVEDGVEDARRGSATAFNLSQDLGFPDGEPWLEAAVNLQQHADAVVEERSQRNRLPTANISE